MNENFVMQLEDLIPKPGRAELYRELIKDLFLQQSGSQNFERKSLLAQIQTENDSLAKARKLLLDDAIDSIDDKIGMREKTAYSGGQIDGFYQACNNLEECLDKSLQAFKTLKTTYLDGDTRDQ